MRKTVLDATNERKGNQGERGGFFFSRVAEATTFYESANLFSVMRKLATHDIYCVRTLCSSELSSEHASPGGGAADLPSLSGSHPCSCDKEGARDRRCCPPAAGVVRHDARRTTQPCVQTNCGRPRTTAAPPAYTGWISVVIILYAMGSLTSSLANF